ncbi:hypothetical protein [Emticicia sp. C21]|uniref:hypothetical protein n=1 Tax=Emticicia sp. C21 TaxID=2302915 RepID=UPI000E345061|nr:hypothetical protein [Emticicia sp. C21]RFS17541.1 hypothetical protein D0T08_07150 [Emticicia sp. C21]
MLENEVTHLDKRRVLPPVRKPVPWEDFYKQFRQHIVDEHNILNQRTIWLAISQSFFFGGYASVANAPKEAKSPIFAGQQDLLLWLIPSAALVACICIFFGVIARSISMHSLQKKFDLSGQFDENYPPIDAGKNVKMMEVFSVWILPIVFMITWIIILAKQFIHV